MFKKLLSAVVIAGFSMAAMAAEPANELSKENQLAITKKIQALGLDVLDVSKSPIKGLAQVATSRGIFYTSEDGAYFVQGNIFNMNAEMRNETQVAMRVLDEPLRLNRVEKLKTVSDSTIEFKADNEKHVITVFTDTSCGYCRKLHKEMSAYNDAGITVRYLAFPRGGEQSPAFNKMVSVWCADDQRQAMSDAKITGNVASKKCEQPVLKHYDLGVEFGVSGTPAIILQDGSIIPGYKPANELLKQLEAS